MPNPNIPEEDGDLEHIASKVPDPAPPAAAAIGALLEDERDHERLHALMDGHPIPAFMIDATHRVIFWNRAMEALSGTSRDEAMGRPPDSSFFYPGAKRPLLADLVLEGDTASIHRYYGDKFLSTHPVVTESYEATDTLHFGARSVPVYFHAARIVDSRGRLLGAVETIQDISEIREAEERILEYQGRLKHLASELTRVEERERRDLALDLHDVVGQNLAAIKLRLEMLRAEPDEAERKRALEDAMALIDETARTTRTMTFELCPPMLHEAGLSAALEWLAEKVRRDHEIACTFQDDGNDKPLSEDLRPLLYRMVRELLVNVVKHARAQRVSVVTERAHARLRIIVEDDGVGFERDPRGRPTAGSAMGFGLFSIRERLENLGGRMRIESSGEGSRITLDAPLTMTVPGFEQGAGDRDVEAKEGRP